MSGSLLLVLLLEIIGILGLAVVRMRRNESPLH
jgi:flagellar biogenesis protein FliO